MFQYTDPAARDFLGDGGARTEFRRMMQGKYDGFARRVNSAFTWIEAVGALSGGQEAAIRSVDWPAFPLTAATSDESIDSDRFAHQDEYVEWRTEKAAGKLVRVTFITEFPEYFEAFAAVGFDALKAAVRDAIPGVDPTQAELFGPGFNAATATPLARSQSFRRQLTRNPWNNGEKDVLCLTQRFNTLDALFNLLAECGVPRTDGTPQDTCALVNGACGPGRNSDPTICSLAQSAARGKVGYTLRDPAGVRVLKLTGTWKIDGTQIDINDPARNGGVWTVSRNGRRAVLTVSDKLTLDDAPIVTGTQVSRTLRVAADLLTAADAALPDWARINAESGSRGPV